MLSVIAGLCDEQLENANEQYAALSSVRDRPHVMNDEIITRMLRLFREQREDLPIHKEQLSRWRALGNLTPKQRQEVERLEAQAPVIERRIEQILALAEEMKPHTIEQVMAKSDQELALEALRRPAREEDLKAARALLTPGQLVTVRRIDEHMKGLLAQGPDDAQVLASMREEMEAFKRLIDTLPQEKFNQLAPGFPGFFVFAKLLESLAQEIADGRMRRLAL
jgi:hypothetical protein